MLINNLSLHRKNTELRDLREAAAELCHPTASCRCPPWIGWPHMRDIPLHKQNDCSIIYGHLSNTCSIPHAKQKKSKAFICFADFACFAPHYISPLHPYTWACRDCCSSSRAGPCPWATGRFRLSKGQVTNKKLLLTKFHKSICRRKECHQYAELRLPLKCIMQKRYSSTFHFLNLSPTNLPLIGTPPGDYATA